MILIVTNKFDVHADEAIHVLNARGVPVFRLNTEDLLTKYHCEFSLQESGSTFAIRHIAGRSLDFRSLRVAWFRKPEYEFNFASQHDPGSASFITAEAKAVIETIYSLPSVTWVNDPFVASRAKVKLQQLIAATAMGMRTPRTVITNIPQVAWEFYEASGRDLLTKAVYSGNASANGIPQAIPSTRLTPSQFEEAVHSIAFLPAVLQHYVDKAFELRITVIGKRAFAVKIESQIHEETKVDWRIETDLNPHSPFDLPERIADFCVQFVAQQGLLFGAIDMIVRPDGEYVFLENNPFGQYLWLERMTGVPLTEAMCDFLMSFAFPD